MSRRSGAETIKPTVDSLCDSFTLLPKFQNLPRKFTNQIRAIPTNGELSPRMASYTCEIMYAPLFFQVPLPTKQVLLRMPTNQMSACVAGTEVCGCHRGRNDFYHHGKRFFLPPWNFFWFFTVEIQSVKWRYSVEYIQGV